MQNNQAIPFNKENFKQIFSKEFALVILVSIPGALIADFFDVPLAWFLGPMLITSLVTLGGLKTKMPKLVLSTILIFLGLYIGNYVDKNLFSQMHQWFWTSLVMLGYIIVSVLLVSKYLQKFSGYGRKTSIFSAGLPLTKTMSANFPSSRVPSSLSMCRASAAFLVVVIIASIGFMPRST